MLAEAFHLNHPKMTGTLCGGQTLPAVVNGAEWKKLSGALMDYVYFKEGTLMVRSIFHTPHLTIDVLLLDQPVSLLKTLLLN